MRAIYLEKVLIFCIVANLWIDFWPSFALYSFEQTIQQIVITFVFDVCPICKDSMQESFSWLVGRLYRSH